MSFVKVFRISVPFLLFIFTSTECAPAASTAFERSGRIKEKERHARAGAAAFAE